MDEDRKYFDIISLKLAVKVVTDVLTMTGIYPQSTSIWDEKTKTEKDKKLRTEWQDGHNAAVMKITKKIGEHLDKLTEGISDDLAILLIAEIGYINHNGTLILNLNDTFWYACADAEPVPENEVSDVALLFYKYGYNGIVYWAAKKRGFDPEIPKYSDAVEYVRKVEKERGNE